MYGKRGVLITKQIKVDLHPIPSLHYWAENIAEILWLLSDVKPEEGGVQFLNPHVSTTRKENPFAWFQEQKCIIFLFLIHETIFNSTDPWPLQFISYECRTKLQTAGHTWKYIQHQIFIQNNIE